MQYETMQQRELPLAEPYDFGPTARRLLDLIQEKLPAKCPHVAKYRQPYLGEHSVPRVFL